MIKTKVNKTELTLIQGDITEQETGAIVNAANTTLLGEEAHVFIDLRQDTIEAIPYPGQAIGMKETFLYGRGVIESILEGKVLELFLGKRTLTTAFLMQEAGEA